MSLKSLYQRAANGGLRIGFEYSKGEIWNPELKKCEPVNVRLDVTIAAVDRKYYYDNEELDTGKISRTVFLRLLKRYAKHGYMEINS